MAAGSIDAFDTWEPHVANAKKAFGEGAIPLDTKGLYSETFNIVVTQPYLAANPAIVSKFLAALIEAEGWVKAHPDEAIDIIATASGMKRDDLAPIWSDYVFHVRLDDSSDAEDPCRLAARNRQSSAWGGHARFLQVIATAPLKALDAARVTLSASP